MSDDSGDESDESGSSEVELDLSLDENGRMNFMGEDIDW